MRFFHVTIYASPELKASSILLGHILTQFSGWQPTMYGSEVTLTWPVGWAVLTGHILLHTSYLGKDFLQKQCNWAVLFVAFRQHDWALKWL